MDAFWVNPMETPVQEGQLAQQKSIHFPAALHTNFPQKMRKIFPFSGVDFRIRVCQDAPAYTPVLPRFYLDFAPSFLTKIAGSIFFPINL